MATLQTERQTYRDMFGDDSIMPENEGSLNDYDEAIFLYQWMLEETLNFRPDDKEEIALLNREIAECKFKKRELLRALKNTERRKTA